jgi:hypothetical protein
MSAVKPFRMSDAHGVNQGRCDDAFFCCFAFCFVQLGFRMTIFSSPWVEFADYPATLDAYNSNDIKISWLVGFFASLRRPQAWIARNRY